MKSNFCRTNGFQSYLHRICFVHSRLYRYINLNWITKKFQQYKCLLNKLQIEFESMVNSMQEIASFVIQCYSSKILISNSTHTHTHNSTLHMYILHSRYTWVLCYEGHGLEKRILYCHSNLVLSLSLFLSLSRCLFSFLSWPVPCYHHHFELHFSQTI